MLSMVTRQPAIQLGITLPVALDAEIHLEADRRNAIQGFHGAMALHASDISQPDVRLVLEFHEVRHIEDPYPGDRIGRIEISPFLPDLGMEGDDIFMAEEAFLYIRYSGPGGALHEWMAEPAVDLLHAGMHPMAEGDRLSRTKRPMRVDIEEKGHPRPKENHQQPPGYPGHTSLRILIPPLDHRPSHPLRYFAALLFFRFMSYSIVSTLPRGNDARPGRSGIPAAAAKDHPPFPSS